MSTWHAISTREHFRGATVYERKGGPGRAFQIVFRNKEPRSAAQNRFVALVFLGLLGLSLLGFLGEFLPSAVRGFAVLVGGVGGLLWVFTVGMLKNRTTTRAIELDGGNQRFRVRCDGKVTYERPISSFKNLSVDDHPDVVLERDERQRKRKDGPGPLEKQHCLMGWFGPPDIQEGAEQVELVHRIEWPKRYSLREVASAVNWTLNYAANTAAGAQAEQVQARAAAPGAQAAPGPRWSGTGGLNPPLD